jgi:hypothetical protein
MSWLLRDAAARDASYAFAVLKALRAGGVAASVPMTWGLEIGNVLARAEGKAQNYRGAKRVISRDAPRYQYRGGSRHVHTGTDRHLAARMPLRPVLLRRLLKR